MPWAMGIGVEMPAVAPGPLSQMHNAWQAGDLDTAMAINERLMPLHDALFCEFEM